MKRSLVLIRVTFLAAFVILSFLLSSTKVYAKSGCCSWHDGVSRCDTTTGRYICNDGTYSPSCTCTKYVPSKYNKPTYTPPTNENTSYSKPSNVSYSSSKTSSDDSAVTASYLILGGGGFLAYLLRKKK